MAKQPPFRTCASTAGPSFDISFEVFGYLSIFVPNLAALALLLSKWVGRIGTEIYQNHSYNSWKKLKSLELRKLVSLHSKAYSEQQLRMLRSNISRSLVRVEAPLIINETSQRIHVHKIMRKLWWSNPKTEQK